MRIAAEWLRDDLFELCFDVIDAFAGRQAGAVRNAKDVRVHGEGLLAEGSVQDHIGGLAPDARKRLQSFAGARHVAAETVDQRLRQGDDVFGLGVEKADRLDRAAK